jgi:hypothetical protein
MSVNIWKTFSENIFGKCFWEISSEKHFRKINREVEEVEEKEGGKGKMERGIASPFFFSSFFYLFDFFDFVVKFSTAL